MKKDVLNWEPAGNELAMIHPIDDDKVKVDVGKDQRIIVMREYKNEEFKAGRYTLKDMKNSFILWLPAKDIEIKWGIPASQGIRDRNNRNIGICGKATIKITNYNKFLSSFGVLGRKQATISKEALSNIIREEVANAIKKILPNISVEELEQRIEELVIELDPIKSRLGIEINIIIMNHVEY